VIALLRGRLRHRLEDRAIVECGGVGYEILLPPVAMKQLPHEDEIELSIHYHATRDQPRPVLIGFVSDLDREFFERLITVKDIGPLAASRALTVPVPELAAAIARGDEAYLRRLPGIGPQKAKNIVAQLQGKVAKFALAREADGTAQTNQEPLASRPASPGAASTDLADELRSLVWDVLVKQLGHRPGEASQLITDAIQRRPGIQTAEELFDEIYRGNR
jgi:Holliday junction DNA helicase RuvA